MLVLVDFMFYISYVTYLALWLRDFNKLTYRMFSNFSNFETRHFCALKHIRQVSSYVSVCRVLWSCSRRLLRLFAIVYTLLEARCVLVCQQIEESTCTAMVWNWRLNKYASMALLTERMSDVCLSHSCRHENLTWRRNHSAIAGW